MRYRGKNNFFKNIIAIFIFIFIFSIVIIVGYIYYTKKTNTVDVDPITLCSKDGIYKKHLVLIDITDTYNFIQLTNIKSEIETIIKNLDKGEQIQIFFLKDKIDTNTSSVIKICNPGTGTDESFIYSNPKLIKKKWDNKFYEPLKNTFSNISSNKEYKQSPIFEMIQFINNSEFKQSNENKSLTIISDMIQNSENFSFFKNKINDFFNSNEFRKLKTNLNNVNVNILYIRRDNHENKQTKEFQNFWIEYFMKNNAELEKIKSLDG